MSEMRQAQPTADAPRRRKVFVSYNLKDCALIDELGRGLGQAGHIVWDERQLTAGADWVAELEQAIDESEAAILVVSKNYVQSLSSSYEAGVLLRKAEEGNLVLIPVVTGELKTSEIPFRLQALSNARRTSLGHRGTYWKTYFNPTEAMTEGSKTGWRACGTTLNQTLHLTGAAIRSFEVYCPAAAPAGELCRSGMRLSSEDIDAESVHCACRALPFRHVPRWAIPAGGGAFERGGRGQEPLAVEWP